MPEQAFSEQYRSTQNVEPDERPEIAEVAPESVAEHETEKQPISIEYQERIIKKQTRRFAKLPLPISMHKFEALLAKDGYYPKFPYPPDVNAGKKWLIKNRVFLTRIDPRNGDPDFAVKGLTGDYAPYFGFIDQDTREYWVHVEPLAEEPDLI